MRGVLIAWLILVAAPAWAEWVKVAASEKLIGYIDPATIRKNGNLRRVWELDDLKARDTDGELSRRSLIEYNCEEGKLRPLSATFHSGPMATGNTIVGADAVGPWVYVPPGTVMEATFRFVCAE